MSQKGFAPEGSNGRSRRGWRALLSLLGRGNHATAVDLVSYRRLALHLLSEVPQQDGARTALLVPPHPSALSGQGTCVLACCLADELARPVLLVDGSAQGAPLGDLVGCPEGRGFSDVLVESELSLDTVVLPTSHEGVFFLPAGARRTTTPAPESIMALLEAASRRFAFTLLAGGSVLSESSALRLAPHVGCVLLAAIESETTVVDLDSARDALEMCGARQVGILLTTPLGW